jgi:hypothetical protein
VEQAKLTAGELSVYFGTSVEIQGDVAVVGARGDGYAGSAYVFQRNGTAWTREDELTPVEDSGFALRTVAVSGDYIVVGARLVQDRGAAHVYRRVDDGWAFGTRLVTPYYVADWGEAAYGYALNQRLAVDGAHVVLGANKDGTAGSWAGAALVYQALGDVDCNLNTINDACEQDCNGNGIPEDCEPFVDCNGNGEHDTCDLRPGGGSEDCNENDVPDECDVAGDTSPDCNRDTIPDECQPNGDCNDNGTPDLCDLWGGVSRDCHGNLIPDECEIADGTSIDLDGNGVPDNCECTAPMFALVPVDASGEHWIAPDDNEIFVTAGQKVWLHVQGCAWDPDLDGNPVLQTWFATIDSRGYDSSPSGRLTPWNPPCTSSVDCQAAHGHTLTDDACDVPYAQPPGGCAPGFQDWSEDPACPSYGDIFLGCMAMYDWGVELSELDYIYWGTGSPFFGLVVDDGNVHYAGTLVLEASPGAAGTFTIPFRTDTWPGTAMEWAALEALRPAKITVVQGCCLPQGTCTSLAPQECVDAGGTPVGIPCEGDCDGDSVVDVCAPFNDCNHNGLPDACDLQNGRSVDSDGNGVPDDCQTGACCPCPPGDPCAETTLTACNDAGGHFTDGVDCAAVTCPTDPPANDDCANAVPVVSYGEYPFDTRCATTDGPSVARDMCIWDGPNRIGRDIWFQFCSECGGEAIVEVTGADFVPLLTAYCGGVDYCDYPALNWLEFACDESGYLRFPLEPLSCYLIRVGGDPGTTGTLTFEEYCIVDDCIWYSPLDAEPQGTEKNRFLSFMGGHPDRPQAVRVTLIDMPAPFENLEGQTMWVGPPENVTEASGANDDTPPTFVSARLGCEPHLIDWSELGVVHVTGEEVVPGATYELQALDAYCFEHPCYYPYCDWFCTEDKLVVTTSDWGDVVGDCSVTPCTGPDGRVDFVDITAVVDKFKNSPGAPIKARADVSPDPPEGIIDFIDLSWVVGAFRGESYPYDGAAGCE